MLSATSTGVMVRAGYALQSDIDQWQPSTAPRHGPFATADRLRPAWQPDTNLSLVSTPSSQRAFPANGLCYTCLEPHCRVYHHSMPYQPDKPATSPSLKSAVLFQKQAAPYRPPPSNVQRYVSHPITCCDSRHLRPMTAGVGDVFRPITDCDTYAVRPVTARSGGVSCPISGHDSYVARPMTAGINEVSRPITVHDSHVIHPMTAGYSHQVAFSEAEIIRSPVNDAGQQLQLPCQATSASHPVVRYRWHPPLSPSNYQDVTVQYGRRKDMTAPQWSPSHDHTISLSRYRTPKLPPMVEVVGQTLEGAVSEQKVAEYRTATVADDVSYRYQLVRTETMQVIGPSAHIPSRVHIQRPVQQVTPSVHEFAALPPAVLEHPPPYSVSPRTYQLVPRSSMSIQSISGTIPIARHMTQNRNAIIHNGMWTRDDQLNSSANRLVTIGASVDFSGSSLDTFDSQGTSSAKVDEGDIDILAKATEGLFSPGDGERLMTEEEDDNCLLFERNQVQESLVSKCGNDAATDHWQAFSSENMPYSTESMPRNIIDQHNSSVIADQSYTERVCPTASNIEQYGGNIALQSSNNDHVDGDGIFAQNPSSIDVTVKLSGFDQMTAKVIGSGSIVSEIADIVTKYATKHGEQRSDDPNCRHPVDNGTDGDCNDISDSVPLSHQPINVDDSSDKVTFSESDLYEMVDRIERMDACSGPRKRPVHTPGLIYAVKKRRKLSRSGTKRHHHRHRSFVYHIPETSGKQTSNENSHLDSGCDRANNVASEDRASLQKYSCFSVSNASGLSSSPQGNIVSGCQMESGENFGTADGSNNTGVAITPTQPSSNVLTTTIPVSSDITPSDSDATLLQSECPMTTTTATGLHPGTGKTTTTFPLRTTTTTARSTATTNAHCSVTPIKSILSVFHASTTTNTTASPRCTTATTTYSPRTAAATTMANPVRCATTTNAPTTVLCSVVLTNMLETCAEHSNSGGEGGGVKYPLSRQEDGNNQQENRTSRNCFDFLVGLSSSRRRGSKYSAAAAQNGGCHHSTLN